MRSVVACYGEVQCLAGKCYLHHRTDLDADGEVAIEECVNPLPGASHEPRH